MVEANELSESHGIRSLRFKSHTQRNFGEVVSDICWSWNSSTDGPSF
jgi:hypothetical protein